jgi:hypothetical protein
MNTTPESLELKRVHVIPVITPIYGARHFPLHLLPSSQMVGGHLHHNVTNRVLTMLHLLLSLGHAA